MSFHALFDGSDADLLPRGIPECAAYLRQYNAWRRSDVEDIRKIEHPHPRELGLHIDFAAEALDAIAGHDHLMVIAAMRYCLGRSTYIVGDCAEFLKNIWPLLSEKTRSIIKRDIEEAFKSDDEARAEGCTYRALGMDYDREQWEKVRQLWA